MADISAKLVQELRQKTGAGMMDCKKALKENDGDIEKSIEWLRQKGIAKADKSSSKIAAEGLVDTYIQSDSRTGVLLEVNCQTDFVGRNEEFKALANNLAKKAGTADTVESLLSQSYGDGDGATVDSTIKQMVAKLGENIQVRRFISFTVTEGSQGVVDSYIHTGGRVGVLVEIQSKTDTAQSCHANCCMSQC
jgi:elongation factor Ts